MHVDQTRRQHARYRSPGHVNDYQYARMVNYARWVPRWRRKVKTRRDYWSDLGLHHSYSRWVDLVHLDGMEHLQKFKRLLISYKVNF